MAFERNPDDPSRPPPGSDERLRGAAQFDSDLQPDPELAEGRASGGRIALFAIAIIAILGVVFYGLNNASMTSPEGQSSAQTTSSPPAGQTTGSATTAPRPAAPPAANNPAPAAPQDSGAPAGGAAK
jgi:predicted lipid-binding transport protein (Tim44 family)